MKKTISVFEEQLAGIRAGRANPKILDKVEDISTVLKDKKISRVMLVTDKSIRQLGITSNLEKNLVENNIELTVFDEVVSNPTVENVENAREIYLKNNCQALIGFGGGSAIDCAKAVGARVAKPKQKLKNMAGILRILKRIPLLFAIPTTAGTGTETTVARVADKGTWHIPGRPHLAQELRQHALDSQGQGCPGGASRPGGKHRVPKAGGDRFPVSPERTYGMDMRQLRSHLDSCQGRDHTTYHGEPARLRAPHTHLRGQ